MVPQEQDMLPQEQEMLSQSQAVLAQLSSLQSQLLLLTVLGCLLLLLLCLATAIMGLAVIRLHSQLTTKDRWQQEEQEISCFCCRSSRRSRIYPASVAGAAGRIVLFLLLV